MEPSIKMLKHSATCFLLYLQDVRHVISISIDLRVESLGGCGPPRDHPEAESQTDQSFSKVAGTRELSYLSHMYCSSLENIYGVPLMTFIHLQRVLITDSVSTYTHFEFYNSPSPLMCTIITFPSGTPFAFSVIFIHTTWNPSPSPPTSALLLRLPQPSRWKLLLPKDGEWESGEISEWSGPTGFLQIA